MGVGVSFTVYHLGNRSQLIIDFYYPCVDKDTEGNAVGEFSLFPFEYSRLLV